MGDMIQTRKLPGVFVFVYEFPCLYIHKTVKIEWINDNERKGWMTALFCFSFLKNSRFVPSGEKQKIFMV